MNQLAGELRTGRKTSTTSITKYGAQWGGEVDVDSASWRTFTEQKGLTGEAPRNGLGGARTRLKDWLTPNPGDRYGTGWGITNEVLRDADHPQLTLKL